MRASFATIASMKVMERLAEQGHEAVFVGGAVRDHLLGKQATDIDIATSAEPHEVKKIFPHTIDIGISHGTVLVVLDQESIEVTTYRTGEGRFEKSLRVDLLHRDFTINALALTKDGDLVDLYGGQEDLNNRVIRAVGVAQERMEEDPLRMIRACRFASVLDFEVEKATFETINQQANLVENVAVERIKVELDKLFLGQNPYKGLQLILQSGLAQALPLFPQDFTHMKAVFPFNSAEEGWATLMLLGHFTANEISAAYKLSNDEKKFLLAVQNAYQIRQQHSFTKDEVYFFDTIVLYVSEKIYRAMNDEIPAISMKEIERQKAALPIQSKENLQVNGQDLLRWAGGKGGRWVGEWMQKIEYAVLHERCENHPNTIKEWFINDFNSER